MELFQNVVTIRISNTDKYLTAEEDEESVYLHRKTSSRSIWTVELVPGEDFIRLKSCYGKYLAASDTLFLPGTSARKVIQTLSERPDPLTIWEPVIDGFSAQFKTPFGHFLRHHGGLPPWRNYVTHDAPHWMGKHEKVLWHIDVVEFVHKSTKQSSTNIQQNKWDDVFPKNAKPSLALWSHEDR